MKEKQSLSVSISESAIAVGSVHLVDGGLVCSESNSYPINNWASVSEVIKQWANAILDFTSHTPPDKLSIAMPGPFDYTEGVSYIKENRNLKSLYGKHLKQLLAKKLSIADENIEFYNDAVCALAAENLPKDQQILALYFDEGFGSAWLRHNVVTDAQLWNEPFLNGKAEDYFSAKWLRKTYFQLTGLSIANLADINDFSSMTGKDLLKEFIENLASYLKGLVEQKKVDGVLLGGAMLSGKVNILAPLKKRLTAMGLEIAISKSTLGNLAPLVGAAVLGKKIGIHQSND